jgi:aminoglycoside phosphotransferase (APT) family kinase protein
VQTRSGAEIVIDGDVVHKLHRPGTDPRQLAARVRFAAESRVLLSPLSTALEEVGDRWRTFWPCVKTVAPQPECLPWADAGELLARLHREKSSVQLPPHGWPLRLHRAIAALDDDSDDTVRRAAAALPDAAFLAGAPGRPETVVHGDFHLGQLGRRDPASPWLLIDVDDLGIGDPAWDLARPSGFWAAGLIPDEDWAAFVDAYRDADGLALPPDGDPWPILDPYARAAVVQAAAHEPDDELLRAACARMAS